MQLVGVEGSDEVADSRLRPSDSFGYADDGESETFGVLFGLADLSGTNLDLGVVGPVALDLDLVHDPGRGVFGEDVEAGIVVILLDRVAPEVSFGGHDGGHCRTIGFR